MNDFKRVQIIQALAGSGKTQLLAYRFIRLLAMKGKDGNEIDPKTILSTTFSRKAAGEIRDRIVDMLSEAILCPEKLVELQSVVPEIKSNNDCVVILRKLVAVLHRLNICTIDSFFVKTALAFSDMLGFTQGWSILDEVNEQQVFEDAVIRVATDSGTTKQLAEKILLSKLGAKVPIYGTIESLKDDTFFQIRGAPEEVWKWGIKRKPISQTEIDRCLDAISALDIKNKTFDKAGVKSVENVKKGDWKSFLTGGVAKNIVKGMDKFSSVDLEKKILSAYDPLIQHALNTIANDVFAKNESTYDLMHALWGSWMQAKHDRALYSFDDVTYELGNSGAIDCLEQDRLLELQFRMDGSIDHLLIDEFQDTSLNQWRILEPIVQEIHQEFHNKDRSLFFVGDVKQSLYGFRGGEPALLRGLSDSLGGEEAGVHMRRLEASWRCTPPVLEAVNTVFENAVDAKILEKKSKNSADLWLNDFTHHESAPPTKRKKGYAVVQSAGDTHESILLNDVEKVVEVVSKIHKDAPSASIGILVRGNTKQQVQRIVHALRTNPDKGKRVLAAEVGGNPLTDSPAVTVILSALLVADNAANTVNKFQVEHSPIGEFMRELSGTAIRTKLLREGYATFIHTLATKLVPSVDKRERLRLWQLVEFAEQHASDVTIRPSDFVRLVEDSQVPDPATSQVQVMTIHKSKGLSFDAVIVCDLDSALWKTPNTLSYHDSPTHEATRVGVYASDYLDTSIPEYVPMRKESYQNQVNDALCLLYVAMTRAKHALHVVVPCRESRTNDDYLQRLDGLILQILGEDQNQKPDALIWEADGNDETWVDSFNDCPDEKPSTIPPFVLSPPKEALNLGRGLATASPSALEGGGKTKISERFAGGTNTAFDWGTTVHKWFEDIEWFDGNIPSVDDLIASAPSEEAGRLGLESLSIVASKCIKALQTESVQQLLEKPSGEVFVYCEQEFVLRVAKGTKFAEVEMNETTDVSGSIDRLVVHKDANGNVKRAEVIDWKSDVFEKETLQSKIAHYAPQLATYRLAAAKLLGIDVSNVSACLAFTMAGCIEDITEKAFVMDPLEQF